MILIREGENILKRGINIYLSFTSVDRSSFLPKSSILLQIKKYQIN